MEESELHFPLRAIPGAVIATALAAGCASPGNQEPQALLREADHLEATKALAGAPVSATAWPPADWWKRFKDPQLDGLIGEALASNASVREAEARMRKALAAVGSAGSALVPHIGGRADSTGQRFPEHGLVPPPAAGTWGVQSNLTVELSYDLDLWDRNRAAYRGALDRARAAAVDSLAARLFLSVEVAHAYVELQHAYERLDIADATLKERERILALTRERVGAGLDSRLELKQAEAAVPASREEIVALNETIQLTRNQLAALLGRGPDRGLAISRPRAREDETLALPSNLPAELIGRRPDVVAQRWRVAAARSDIEVAKAEFYPNVDLTAFLGLQSLGFSRLLQAGSAIAGIGPAASLPIFDGGRRRANLAGTGADYDAAVERYNQTLVDAVRDVVDQLASLQAVDRQRQQLQIALNAAQDAYDLALARYKDGLGNYLHVLSAESQALAQQSLAADLRARELDRSIDLIRALGGGYDNPDSAAAAGAMK